MTTFIRARHSDNESFAYHPVNLDFCKCIRKINDEGTYVIFFVGCDTRWTYRLKGNRDAEFELILQDIGLYSES